MQPGPRIASILPCLINQAGREDAQLVTLSELERRIRDEERFDTAVPLVITGSRRALVERAEALFAALRQRDVTCHGVLMVEG